MADATPTKKNYTTHWVVGTLVLGLTIFTVFYAASKGWSLGKPKDKTA